MQTISWFNSNSNNNFRNNCHTKKKNLKYKQKERTEKLCLSVITYSYRNE